MKQYTKTLRNLLWVIVALSLIGCGAKQSNSLDDFPLMPTPSGFLADYSKLSPSVEIPGAYTYLNKSKHLYHYKIVMIDPVEVFLHADSEAKDVDPRRLDQLARFFEKSIRDSLGDSYPTTEKPGFGVLKIRAAITDIRPKEPLLKIAPEDSIFGLRFDGASIEVEFLDAMSGDQVAAFVDSQDGRRYRTGYEKRGGAQDALYMWSLLLRDRLDMARGLHPGSAFTTSKNLFR